MPELRQDPLTKRWVVISKERAKRPQDFRPTPVVARTDTCPFCEGNENQTPPEIWAFRGHGSAKDGPGWWIRTVPNKFPALGIEGSLEQTARGLFTAMNGLGAHEVIVETPLHQVEFYKHSQDQMEEVLRMWRDRLLDLRQDRRLKYILIFKNEGAEAGASLEHAHSQLMALPMMPKSVTEEVEIGIKPHLASTSRCIFCDMVAAEIEAKERLVLQTERFVAYCPFASRFPFETWILPKNHEPDFGLIDEPSIGELASVLRQFFSRLAAVLNNPPFNLLLHTTPVNIDLGVSYHWHIEVLPRLTKTAGFEYGTDYYINPTPPEMAAESLRSSQGMVVH